MSARGACLRSCAEAKQGWACEAYVPCGVPGGNMRIGGYLLPPSAWSREFRGCARAHLLWLLSDFRLPKGCAPAICSRIDRSIPEDLPRALLALHALFRPHWRTS